MMVSEKDPQYIRAEGRQSACFGFISVALALADPSFHTGPTGLNEEVTASGARFDFVVRGNGILVKDEG